MSDQNRSDPASAMQQTVIEPGSKVKDPKRVAAGKRLGAISKQAKEAKALRLERQSAEMNSGNNEYTLYLVGGLVVVGAVSYLYLNKEKLTRDKKKLPTIPEEPPKRKSKRIFDE